MRLFGATLLPKEAGLQALPNKHPDAAFVNIRQCLVFAILGLTVDWSTSLPHARCQYAKPATGGLAARADLVAVFCSHSYWHCAAHWHSNLTAFQAVAC